MRENILLDILSKNKIKISISFVIIIIIVIIILILYFTGVFNKSSNNNTTNNNTTNTDKASSDKIKTALASSGVITPGQENFQTNTTIVFDTKEKLIKNFDLFMNTYYPSLNIAEMNNMLKNYGVPKTVQEFLIENINSSGTDNYITGLLDLMELYPSLFGIEFKTGGNLDDIICAGLGAMVIVKIFDEIELGNSFYLNDFKDTNDFYVYITPKSYDISKVISMKSEIKDYDKNNPNEYYTYENDKTTIIKPYKMGLYSMSINRTKRQILYKKANQYAKETGSNTADITKVSVSEEEINSILQSFKDSRESYLKLLRIYLIKDFIILDTKQYFTESSQIVKDLIELCKPENKHFNQNLYEYGFMGESNRELDKLNRDRFGVVPTTSPQTFMVPDNYTLPTTSSAPQTFMAPDGSTYMAVRVTALPQTM